MVALRSPAAPEQSGTIRDRPSRGIARAPTPTAGQGSTTMDIEALFARVLHLHRHDESRVHQDAGRAHEMFQTAPIAALLQGVYDGDVTFGELGQHGDFGLGTFNALDGEMIALDGAFFQITSDGSAHPVPPEAKTPFAVVTFFQPDRHLTLDQPLDLPAFQQWLDGQIASANIFYAVKATGSFDYLKTRSVPRQSQPYRPLTEVVETQPICEFHEVRGTLAGFRFPNYAEGLNVPGYHLHFLTEDRTRGGHVLDCRIAQVDVAIDHSSDLHLEVPDDAAFQSADLSGDTRDAIRKAEQ